MVDDCLSEAHRNYPGMGCPVSALAGDLARSDKHTRAVATPRRDQHGPRRIGQGTFARYLEHCVTASEQERNTGLLAEAAMA